MYLKNRIGGIKTMEREEFEKKYKTYATIYCQNADAVQDIKKMYKDKGYTVCQAGTMITTGTHGDICCKQLDIMTEFTEEEYKVSDAEDEAFRIELDKIRMKYTSKQAVDYMHTKPVKSVEFHHIDNENIEIFLCHDGNVGIGKIGDGKVRNFNRNDYINDLWYRIDK